MERKMERRAVCRQFTLIEIMIVVVIIGMLAAVVAPKLMGNLDKSKVSTTKQQVVNLKKAVQDYKLDIGDYPDSLDDLMANSQNNPKWDGPYLEAKTLPKDAWDRDFIYRVPGEDGMKFDILSYGADGAAGGDGYDADISCW